MARLPTLAGGLATLAALAAAIPADPHYFTQLVDHFSFYPATYQQRYYMNDTNFGKDSEQWLSHSRACIVPRISGPIRCVRLSATSSDTPRWRGLAHPRHHGR